MKEKSQGTRQKYSKKYMRVKYGVTFINATVVYTKLKNHFVNVFLTLFQSIIL